MKRSIVLAILLFFGLAVNTFAIDFTIHGRWRYGVGVGDMDMTKNVRQANGKKVSRPVENFVAGERIQTHIQAIASESLRGFVGFELGPMKFAGVRPGMDAQAGEPWAQTAKFCGLCMLALNLCPRILI